MPNVNDFVPFCPTSTGTNLDSQADYLVDPDRTIGNQPGIASSKLNNKALRQGTYIAGQMAQYISNQANVSVLDDNTPAKLLAQIMGAFQPLAPIITSYLSGTGTWSATFYFFIASGSATSGATYTNNAVTYTVSATVSGATVVRMTGIGLPSAGGGTLTKASGTGDATITFYAFRSALFIEATVIGAGGGGAGGGAGANGSDGTDTTFGTITAGKGTGAINSNTVGAPGGTPTSTYPGFKSNGETGGGTGATIASGSRFSGGVGGAGPFGGQNNNDFDSAGANGSANSGAGGQGGGNGAAAGSVSGSGAGAGAYVLAYISPAIITASYSVGVGGAHGAGAGSGHDGGDGGSGLILLKEIFQ